MPVLMAILTMLHQPAHVAHTAAPRANRGAQRTHAVTAVTSAQGRNIPTGPCGGWRALVATYSWDVGDACAVLMCESHGHPDARNPTSGATGLFQILRGGSTDPERNVAQAYGMYAKSGWRPWKACR